MRKSVHWPTGAEVRQKPISGGAMLYDASRAGNATVSWFDRTWWARRGEVQQASEGRGGTVFIEADNRRLVLRQYRRGGGARLLSADRYLWHSPELTRSFAEWHMLYLMRRANLPVPSPIGACYWRVGRFGYRAALLTEQLRGVRSLASLLLEGSVPLLSWVAIGRCLRRFHDDGVCHADLNAHNVLLAENEQVWLVDFDRARLRKPGMWCDANLVRLRRSIEKLTDGLRAEHFSEADWGSLLSGYFAATQAAEPAF